jgi:hypothetical protein
MEVNLSPLKGLIVLTLNNSTAFSRGYDLPPLRGCVQCFTPLNQFRRTLRGELAASTAFRKFFGQAGFQNRRLVGGKRGLPGRTGAGLLIEHPAAERRKSLATAERSASAIARSRKRGRGSSCATHEPRQGRKNLTSRCSWNSLAIQLEEKK